MSMDGALRGQSALITGAASGIGAGIARALAQAGATVAVNDNDLASAARTTEQITAAGGQAVLAPADVSQEAEVIAMFDRIEHDLGTLDILVNNAGIERNAPLLEMTLADWNAVIGVNLTGYFLCAREATRMFMRRREPRPNARARGVILCVSSVHDEIPWAEHANYAASKGGVDMLMKTMAQELGPSGIRVNAISPGAIMTDINRAAWETPEARARLLQLIPYGRVGVIDDVAAVAVWLASDAADYVSGATLYVDGGMMLYPAFRKGG